MDIEQKIIDDLAALDLPIFEQGTWTGGELPDEFLTYFIADSYDTAHYDNLPAQIEFQVQLNFYTLNPENIKTTRAEISKMLLRKGWMRDGLGTSGSFEDKTTFTAWHMVFYFAIKETLEV